jgi:hypothetical protein
MRTPRLPESADGLVRLPVGKGAVLILTVDEYVRGLNRGKQERRAASRTTHVDKQRADRDAHTLAWITAEEERCPC